MFSHLADLARTAVEAVHGEAVTVRPMDRVGGPNGKRGASAERAAFATTALFHEDSAPARGDLAQPQLGAGRLMHRSPPVTASLRLPAAPAVRTDDIVERSDGRRYEITEINPDGLGGALVALALARPAEG